MSWNDDSWRDSYDDWKLASPDDYDGPDECPHDGDVDIDMDGLAHCNSCGMTWRASSEEIITRREEQAEYDAWYRKQKRRERWLRLTLWLRWPIFRLLEKVWPRKAHKVLSDSEYDDIPF